MGWSVTTATPGRGSPIPTPGPSGTNFPCRSPGDHPQPIQARPACEAHHRGDQPFANLAWTSGFEALSGVLHLGPTRLPAAKRAQYVGRAAKCAELVRNLSWEDAERGWSRLKMGETAAERSRSR